MNLSPSVVQSIRIVCTSLEMLQESYPKHKWISSIIKDVRSVLQPEGEFSFWSHECQEYWGDQTWYLAHCLQPVGDYWHARGLASIQDERSPEFWLVWNQVGLILQVSSLFSNKGWFTKNWFVTNIGK